MTEIITSAATQVLASNANLPLLKMLPADAPSFRDAAVQLNKNLQEKLKETFYSAFRTEVVRGEGAPHPLCQLFLDSFSIYDTVEPLSGYNTHRQTQNCNCCLHTIRQLGDVVIINLVTGTTKSLFWDETGVDPYYAPAIKALREKVEKAKVIGGFVFTPDMRDKLNADPTHAGHAAKGEIVINGEAVPFNHFYFDLAGLQARNIGGLEAEPFFNMSVEAFKSLTEHLAPVTLETLKKADGYFRNDAQLSSIDAKFAGVVNWFYLTKQRDLETLNRRIAENHLWTEAASPYHGRTNFLNTAPGQFVMDLQNNVDFDVAKRAFLKKIDARNYMVATEAPSEGNKAAAEKIIADLGRTLSLERRFARLDEIPAFVWKSADAPIAEAKSGVFANVKTKDQKAASIEDKTIIKGGTKTWVWFEKNALPKAVKLEMAFNHRLFCFCVTTTAVHPEAPPIHKHDLPERRNPLSNMLISTMHHHVGCTPDVFDIPKNELVEISAITYVAAEMTNEAAHATCPRQMIIKAGKVQGVHGRGLFPAELIPELYPVRSTITAFSDDRDYVMDGADESFVSLFTGNHLEYNVYVTDADGHKTHYFIDRNE